MVIDTGTDTITNTISVGSYPEDIVSTGTKLYVSNYSSNDISVIDTNTNTVVDTISLTKSPIRSIIVGDYLYVAGYNNPDPGTVFVIDLNTNTIITSIPIEYSPSSVSFNLVGTNLYVIGSSAINIINTVTNTAGSVACPPIPTAPTVVNRPATAITKTTATIKAEITEGSDITDRFFIYLKASDFNDGNPDEANLFQTPLEHGSYNTGEFSADISDLLCGTDYLYLGFALNNIGQGIAFDPLGTFTTLPCGDDVSQSAPIAALTSSGGIHYGCKDPSATNYDAFSASKPELCKYETQIPGTTKKETIMCPITQQLTQNLRAPSRNGVYNSYTKGIVKEAHILQAHLNRLGFNSGKEDGILGPKSETAIKKLQKFLNVAQDGKIGPKSREVINSSCGA